MTIDELMELAKELAMANATLAVAQEKLGPGFDYAILAARDKSLSTFKSAVETFRAATIEECAAVCDWTPDMGDTHRRCADAIRPIDASATKGDEG